MIAGSVCFLFVIIPSAAFSWSQATHAYISDSWVHASAMTI
jgi:hypothetical protein